MRVHVNSYMFINKTFIVEVRLKNILRILRNILITDKVLEHIYT